MTDHERLVVALVAIALAAGLGALFASVSHVPAGPVVVVAALACGARALGVLGGGRGR